MTSTYLSPYFNTPYSHNQSVAASTFSPPVYEQVLSWIILIPLIYFAVYGQFSFLNHSNSSLMTESGELLQTSQGIRPQAILYVVVMTAFILTGYRQIWRVVLRNKLLALCLPLAALSAIWSESPLLTLRSSLELAMTTLFAFYLSERFSTEHLMKLLVLTGTVAGTLSILLIFFVPEYGIYHRDSSGAWQGIFSHKNALGVGMAFLFTPVLFLKERLSLKVIYIPFMLFLIVMSQSRGAWFVTLGVIAFAGWLFVFRRLAGKESFLLTAITTVAIAATVIMGVLNLNPLVRLIGKDPTLTGRTEIYRVVFDSVLKRPILGYGYGAFWHGMNHESVTIGLRLHWMTIGYAENGFLELWLGLGTLGLALTFWYFGRATRQSLLLLRSDHYTPRVGWFCAILFLELITNIDAGAVLAPGHIEWALSLIAFIGLSNEVRTSQLSQATAS